ncbi:MAG: YdcF family protein [Proteobacteria bacterium]|nr:YdcF family protein [Pseudomonadota bacterium]
MQRPAIVIFGAAVLPDGRASPSLRRRIRYAVRAAAERPDAPVYCSGGVGATPPSEASVMRQELLAQGVAAARIVLDEESLDTLQSVVAAARFVRREGLDGCVVCTDSYHQPRCRLLLALLGVPSAASPTDRGPSGTRRYYWAKMHLREALALPYDAAIVLARLAYFRRITREAART